MIEKLKYVIISKTIRLKAKLVSHGRTVNFATVKKSAIVLCHRLFEQQPKNSTNDMNNFFSPMFLSNKSEVHKHGQKKKNANLLLLKNPNRDTTQKFS